MAPTSPSTSPLPKDTVSKAPKRQMKPIIPALPLLPKAKKDTASESQYTMLESSAKVTRHEMPEPNTAQAESEASTDMLSPKETSVTVEQEDYLTSGTNHELDLHADPNQVVEQQVAVLPETSPAEVPDLQEETGSEQPATTTQEPPMLAEPLIIDSSAMHQRKEINGLGLSNGDQASEATANGSIIFGAPPDSAQSSPVYNGVGEASVDQESHLSSPQHTSFLPVTQQWPSERGHAVQASQSYISPTQPAQLSATSFHPDAASFTPSAMSPPYSLSSTPAATTPIRDQHVRQHPHPTYHTLGNGNPSQIPIDTHQYQRPQKYRQSMSFVPAERMDSPQYHATENGDTRSRTTSMGTDVTTGHMTEHLTYLFDNGLWADWSIVVKNEAKAFPVAYFAAHGAVISRNQVLVQLMNHASRGIPGSSSPHNVIDFEWASTLIHPNGFTYALRFVYNETLITHLDVRRLTNPGRKDPLWPSYQIHFALSYFLAGQMLGLGPVITRGRELVMNTMSWDLIEFAMHWAIDYLPQSSFHENGDMAPRMVRNSSATSARSSSSRPTSKKGDTETPQLIIPQAGSDLLLESVIRFLVYNVPFEHIVLDTNAKPNQLKSRLPETRELFLAERQGSNPALQGITFGDFSENSVSNTQGSQAHYGGTDYSRKIASIAFLNLPFDQLDRFFYHLRLRNQSTAYEFAKQVVADRENLRNIVLRSKSINLTEREAKSSEWQVVGFQESVVDVVADPSQANSHLYHGAAPKWQLQKTWQGLKNPNQMGTGGQKKKIQKQKKIQAAEEQQQVVNPFRNGHGMVAMQFGEQMEASQQNVESVDS